MDLHAQLEFLQKSYDKYMKNLRSQDKKWDTDAAANIDESLDVLKSQCDNLGRWAAVYRDRTNIRINLVRTPARLRSGRVMC